MLTLSVLSLASLTLFGAAADAAPRYVIKQLGTFGSPPDGDYSIGNDVNNFGEVTGYTGINDGSTERPILWSGGVLIQLPSLGGEYASGWGINDSGVVVGISDINSSIWESFIYDHGNFQGLGTPMSGGVSDAEEINNMGQIGGSAGFDGSNWSTAFLYDGTWHNIGTFWGGGSSGFSALNNLGVVVGHASSVAPNNVHLAFIYSNGLLEQIKASDGTPLQVVAGINDSGTICGSNNVTINGLAYSRATILKDGIMTDIHPGGLNSRAIAINNLDQVILNVWANSFQQGTWYLWDDGMAYSLFSMLSTYDGFTSFREVAAISDSGHITGTGYWGSQQRAFLMTPVKKRIRLVDYDVTPLSDIAVRVSKITHDWPTFTESFIGEITTDSLGQFELSYDVISPGDSLKVDLILHTEPADKHQTELGTKFTLQLDNMLVDEFGLVSWPEIDEDSVQEIVMSHTTVAWNIVTSIEWDARVDYLVSLQSSFRHMANYLYDVTDGQSRIDTVVILDNKQGWDQADFRIAASNVVWPNAYIYGTDTLTGPVEMPRKWFGNIDDGRELSYSEDPLDVSDGFTFTTLAHEYGHYAFGFYDEYLLWHRGNYSTDSGRCALITNYGFMDSQYPFPLASPYQSEMSNENRYSFPSCWNNLHFQVRGMSCWEWFEQDFEGYYTAVPIFAPMRLPSERLLPSGEEHLVGPNNDLVNLDYDVGAQVKFRSDLSAPTRRTKSVRLTSSATGAPFGNINVVARIANSGIALDQGNTSDSGRIRLLGMSDSAPDTIVASGRTYIVAARRFSNQPTWVSVSAEVPDLDSVEILATPISGDHQFVARPTIDGSVLTFRLFTALPLSGAPLLTSPSGDSIQLSLATNEYIATLTDSLTAIGQFTIHALDNNNDPFAVPFIFRTQLGNGSGSIMHGPGGVCQVNLDTGMASTGRTMLLTTTFPVIATGLGTSSRQAGPAVSLVVDAAGELDGTNGILIRYDDSDLMGGFGDQEHTLRIWQFNESTRAWQLVGGAVDTSQNEVMSAISSTGVYAAFTSNLPVDVDDEERGDMQPDDFELRQNYPNPFNPNTTIRFSLPSRSQVKIEVFNLLGQSVRTLVNSQLAAGQHVIEWSGRDESGQEVASGVYLYRMSAGELELTRKMLLIR